MADPAFSTHGGRQAKGGLAAIDYIANVAEEVPDVPVLFGSGVRSGSDVVKALALGATAVGIGAPTPTAPLGGTDGIVPVLRTILAEADLLMAVDAYPTLADLGRDAIRRT
jgi:lactate 2-monooxygenase